MAEEMEQQVDAIFEHRGKVLCRDCGYYRPHGIAQCSHPNARQVVATWRQEETIVVPPSVRNQRNDCQDFRLETAGEMFVKNPEILIGVLCPIAGVCFALYLLYRWLF